MSKKGIRKAYKIVLIGDPSVGKTSIRRRFMGEGFQEDYQVTLGADFSVKRIDRNVMQIWDLGGQMVYKSIRDQFYRGVSGILIMFDITSQLSFSHIPNWINEALGSLNGHIPIFLIGNKSDLREKSNNSVSVSEVEKYITETKTWYKFDIQYIETSALRGENIHETFAKLVEVIDAFTFT